MAATGPNLFSLLSAPGVTLGTKLAALTRTDLNGSSVIAPDLDFLRSFEFQTVLGRVEQTGGGHAALSARSGVARLAGLHSLAQPWILVAQHQPPFTRFLCGWPAGTTAASGGTLGDQLAAEVGRRMIGPQIGGARVVDEVGRLGACGALTGIPSSGRSGGTPGGPIDTLTNGLIEAPWALIVLGYPLPPEMVVSGLAALAQEIQTTDEVLLTPGTLKEKNQQALRYRRLLEQTQRRLQRGQSLGMWQTGHYLYATNHANVERGLALLLAGATSGVPAPQPMRAHRCERRPDLPDARHNLLSSDELSSLSAWPRHSAPGFQVERAAPFMLARPSLSTSELRLGLLVYDGLDTEVTFTLPRDALARHTLVCGTTGSGKTRTCQRLLHELQTADCANPVPFLVIEPAKAEYRDLLLHAGLEHLWVFTAGNEIQGRSAPLRFNPFYFPPEVGVQFHIDLLKAAFNAAPFVLYAPMPYILEAALHQVYRRKGWDLAASTNAGGLHPRAYPTLTDLQAAIEEAVIRAGYSDRIGADVLAGLRVRIDTLRSGAKGGMLDVPGAASLSELFERPTVIELEGLGSGEDRVFVMALLLSALAEHCVARRPRGSGGQLLHVTLIEEAHRLLRAASPDSNPESGANPRGLAVETFSNLLSEMRAYGEGFVIAEQIPTKLASDVVKNTGTKLVHRLVSKDDREAVGASMGLTREQRAAAMLLGAGEAIVFSDRMRSASRARMDALSTSGRTVDDIALHAHMSRFAPPDSDARLFAPRWAEAAPAEVLRLCREARTHEDDPADARLDVFVATVLAGGDGHQAAAGLTEGLRAELASKHTEGNVESAVMAALIAVVDRGFSARGLLYGWPHAQVDALAYACFAAIYQEQRIADFVRSYFDITRRADGPYSGCAACVQRCAYRYESAALVHRLGPSESFRAQLEPGAANAGRGITRVCRELAGRLLHRGSDDRGVALCYAVHEARARRLSPSLQVQLAGRVAALLGREDS